MYAHAHKDIHTPTGLKMFMYEGKKTLTIGKSTQCSLKYIVCGVVFYGI